MACLLLLHSLHLEKRKSRCPHRSSIPDFGCRNISSPRVPRSERQARFKLHCLALFNIALVGPSVAFVGSWSCGLENLKQTQKEEQAAESEKTAGQTSSESSQLGGGRWRGKGGEGEVGLSELEATRVQLSNGAFSLYEGRKAMGSIRARLIKGTLFLLLPYLAPCSIVSSGIL